MPARSQLYHPSAVEPFCLEDAEAVANEIGDISDFVRRRAATDFCRVAKLYEMSAQKRILRPAEVRRELTSIYRAAGRVGERNRHRLFRALRHLSDEALMCFGVLPEERWLDGQSHPVGDLHRWVRDLAENQGIVSTFPEIRKAANIAISLVPEDRGGPAPRDVATQRLIERTLRIYRHHTGRPATHWNDSEGEFTTEFSRVAIKLCQLVHPAISEAKADDYIREALGRTRGQ